MIEKKIIIGSANLNNKYGIKKNVIRSNEFNSLLNIAFKKGVNIIDTSPSYGKSEEILGNVKKKFKIITKIPKLPISIKNSNIESWVEKIIKNSKKKLKKKIIYAVLIQNAEILLTSKGRIIYKTLIKLRKLGYFNKIGVSIYNPKFLKKIENRFKFNILQLPYNIFYRKVFDQKIFKKLKSKKVEIHARSIFFQGLLLKKNLKLPKKLNLLEKAITKWNIWLRNKKISTLEACLNFILKNRYIYKLVFGFYYLYHFYKIINIKKKKIDFKQFKFKIKKNLLDPRNWM